MTFRMDNNGTCPAISPAYLPADWKEGCFIKCQLYPDFPLSPSPRAVSHQRYCLISKYTVTRQSFPEDHTQCPLVPATGTAYLAKCFLSDLPCSYRQWANTDSIFPTPCSRPWEGTTSPASASVLSWSGEVGKYSRDPPYKGFLK